MLIAARFESIESFRAQWWIGMRRIDGQDPARGLDWLRQAVDLNPNELRLQLDYVRGLLLSNRAEAARALVSTLPREGLVRFPNDARLLRQARELGLEEPYR